MSNNRNVVMICEGGEVNQIFFYVYTHTRQR